MTFDEILEQVIALLKRQGRVSYRALKRRFEIDDDYIEDLKEELIQALNVAIDEDGRVLVSTSENDDNQVSLQRPEQPEPQPIIETDQTTSVESPPTNVPDAERRQLTVMFCDLVGSTELSGKLDPEDYREVVRQYQQVCSEVIQRYDGHIAQYLGDGLLVYFGFPQAHEDDAQRAVRAGLGIIDAIATLNTSLEQDKGVELAIRLGIHTGLVVVGEMGGDGRQEQLALGATPNVAARIQGLAQPDTVVISDATYRLIQGYFDCEPLGEHDLRGVAQPIVVYRVLSDTGIQSRLDVASARGLTPLVGREREVDLLLDRWEQAKDAQGQAVLLSGEAGIGKSRLVQVLKDYVADEPHTRLECRSSPYFTNSALYPITDFLQRTLRFQSDDTPELRLEKLVQNLSQYRLPLEETIPLFGALLSLPVPEDRYPSPNLSPQRQRQKTLEAIVAIILELAEREPVLFILEDLHWTDPTTLEFLELLIDQIPTSSMCMLLTCRPEFQPPWSHRSYLAEITVNRLSRHQIEQMATQVADGKTLPDEIIQQLVDKTDGVPLYVEEMTKAVLESGVLKATDSQYELVGSVASLAIPATLQDSLMARLDRLVTAKAVAQYASVIGRQFSYELLQAVSELDEVMLQHELGRLVDAELVYQRGLPPQAMYTFKHALVQDTAYESLLRSTRQQYHAQIANVLNSQFLDVAANQPELLAHHYTEAGRNEEAVGYWQQAGEHAIHRSANPEAVSHFTKGLGLLQTLPDSPERTQRELDIRIMLGPAFIATQGSAAPEVEHNYARARDLCHQVGDTSQLFPVLNGLRVFYHLRGELQTAHELGEQMLRTATVQHDHDHLLQAHCALGHTSFFLGLFVQARTHQEHGIALYDGQHHRALAFRTEGDIGVNAFSQITWTLWSLGYPDKALARLHDALTLAHELAHPYSLTNALAYAVWLHHFRREAYAVEERAEAIMALADEQGFAWQWARAAFMRGWALVVQGQGEEGLAQMTQGLSAIRATGAALGQPSWLAALAEAYGLVGQGNEGLHVVAEALALVDQHGNRCNEAELYRLKGELLLQQSPDNSAEAESCFQQAITIAQNQNAKSWELRAATSLARLWQRQGKRDEARELLAPVYSWFTEGFDTADLIDAKTLLDELS